MSPRNLVFSKDLPRRVDQIQVTDIRVHQQVRANLSSIHTTYARRRPATPLQATSSQPLNVGLTVATSVALATLVPIALRQFKLIRRLPDPGGHRVFNTDRVVTSRKSRPLGIPDSALGLASYGTTLALVLLAPCNPTARRLVGPKLAVDTGMATVNTVRQFVSFRKMCSWCFLTVAATAAMAIAGRRELRNSL